MFAKGFWKALAPALCLLALGSQAAALRSTATAQSATEEADPAYQQLVDAANAVVGIKVKALANARSNETLGAERTGSGVLIRPNLVLTIGYLILEADQVEVTDSGGQTVPAGVVAYDHATGFGLVRPMTRLAPKPISLGTAQPLSQLDRLLVVTGGGEQAVSIATVVSRRRFAGYWEYLIDGAIFTSPPRLDHSGAALINREGELVGIGSLFVMDALSPGERLPGNMFVPVDLVKPILEEMVRTGAHHGGRRPWLGLNSIEEDGRIKVLQVTEESPAAAAGIEAGDIILRLNGEPVDKLEAFYRKLWDQGAPGVVITLGVLHGTEMRDVVVRSIDRKDFIRKKPGI